MSHSSDNTSIDSSMISAREAPLCGSLPGTTTMQGQPIRPAMLLNSSHSRLIDSYACASRKVTCSMELMLKGDKPDAEKRSLSSSVDRFLRKALSLEAQISR